MATHLLARGRDLCDRALVLEAGRLVFEGGTAEMPGPEGLAASAGSGFEEGA
jgi:ABC-type multidrug transport system ATPase subunit